MFGFSSLPVLFFSFFLVQNLSFFLFPFHFLWYKASFLSWNSLMRGNLVEESEWVKEPEKFTKNLPKSA